MRRASRAFAASVALTPTLLVLLIPRVALALTVPVGPNFRVNTVTDGSQTSPVVDAGGGQFVVVWRGDSGGLLGQRLDGSGARLGGELTVRTSQSGASLVAVAPSGKFLVVWESGGIGARLFDATGVPQGAEFVVAAPGIYLPSEIGLAVDGIGNFIVAWTVGGEIRARRYDATGAPLGSEFAVNTFTTGPQHSPVVAADGAGNFVIVWRDDYGAPGVVAQRYDSAGLPLGSEIQVSAGSLPNVARAASGDFVVAWLATPTAVHAQRFDAAGTPVGGEFPVNTLDAVAPIGLATDAAGDFVTAWRNVPGGFQQSAIRGARFESDGTPQGGDLQLSTYTGGQRIQPRVAGDGVGNFLVVWHDDIGDDVVAQRFSAACGDGALAAGEACDDGNNTAGDGCEANCVPQTCFTCAGAPSSCVPITACVSGDGCCAPGCTPTNDHDCTALISGAQMTIQRRFNNVDNLVFKSRDPGIDTTVGSGIDPVADGAFLHVYNASGSGTSACYELRTSGTAEWEARGTTATGPVFAYTDRDKVVGPCTLARARDGRLLRVKCVEYTVYPLDPPPQGSLAVRFTSGDSAYCSVFGGVRRDNGYFFLAYGAPAPASCPAPPKPCPEIIPAAP